MLAALASAALGFFGAACSGDDAGITYVGTPGRLGPMLVDQWVPWIDVSLDGSERELALVDTGLPLTLLYSSGFGGLAPGLNNVELDAFGLRFVDFDLAVVRRQAAQPVCVGDVPAGLLGHDLFGHFRLGLDYRGQRVVLHDQPAEAGAGLFEQTEGLESARVVAVELLGGGLLQLAEVADPLPAPATRVVTEAIVEGSASTAMVDTGASLTAISRTLFDRLGGSDRPALCCATVEVVDGVVDAEVTRLRELRLGPVSVTSLPVLVLDNPDLFAALGAEVGRPVQMLIGGSLLRQFAVEIDYPGRRLLLQRYLDRPHIDPDEYLLPGFSFCRAAAADGMVVLDVFEGSDGAHKGVERGHLLVAVDGRSVTDLPAADALALIRDRSEGESVKLTFEAQGEGQGGIDLDVALERLLPEYE